MVIFGDSGSDNGRGLYHSTSNKAAGIRDYF
jgi:hypothetical protein